VSAPHDPLFSMVEIEYEVLMTADEVKKLIAEAEQDPKRLAAAVSGVPETVLKRKPAPENGAFTKL